MKNTSHQSFISNTPMMGLSIDTGSCSERSLVVGQEDFGRGHIVAKRLNIQAFNGKALDRVLDLQYLVPATEELTL